MKKDEVPEGTSKLEKKRKPGSVPFCNGLIIYLCDLPSKTGRAALQFDCSNILGLHGLTARKVYLASLITKNCGGLLHPHFTLTRRRFIFCGTFYSAALQQHSRAFHPVRRPSQPGLSSPFAWSDEVIFLCYKVILISPHFRFIFGT